MPNPSSSTPSPPSSLAATLGASALQAMPAVFVLLWSTGFIVARYATPHAGPLTFLCFRFGGTLIVLLMIIAATGAPWPATRGEWIGTAIVGLLMQAAYLGGVWHAISVGMPAGVAALVVGLQPLLTAALAATVGERAGARQWCGLVLGFAGLCMVLSDRLALSGVSFWALLINVMALAGITLGTLLQKRIGGRVDLRTGSAIQFGASLVAIVPLSWWLEGGRADVNAPAFWLSLAWSIFGLSLAAISLLLLLIRRGRATQVASLMYLTPAVTAILAWLAFDQRLGLLACAGLVVTMLGVALAASGRRSLTAEPAA